MNRTNIETTIAILRRAQNFDISSFQGARRAPYENVDTEEELHKCGNTACIAGYVAISPEWIAFGGDVDHGGPSLNGSDYEDAMAVFWDIPVEDASGIIYGDSSLERTLDRYSIEGIDPDKWSQLTKEDAISIFEQMLAHGPAPDIEPYPEDEEDDGC